MSKSRENLTDARAARLAGDGAGLPLTVADAPTPPWGIPVLLAPDNRPAPPPEPKPAERAAIAGGQGRTAAELNHGCTLLLLAVAGACVVVALSWIPALPVVAAIHR